MGNIEELVTSVGLSLGRVLTDEEKNHIVIWEKSRDLAHFVEGFPNEWKLMREMAFASIRDVRAQWDDLLLRDPCPEVNVVTAHALARGACDAISKFVASVENAPDFARQVPDVIKSSIEAMRNVPQEA